MPNDPQKISFIPKSPLVREETFMDRGRPQSLLIFLATIIFLISTGSYIGFYSYRLLLIKDIEAKTTQIRDAQRDLARAPEVEKAKLFLTRANLAKEILDAHVVVTPVFKFLEQDTVSSILYDKFSFAKDADSGWVLDLGGEAPSYAALINQSDLLLKEKGKRFSDFSISNLALTTTGTVTFSMKVFFSANDLSYTKNLAAGTAAVEVETPAPSATPAESVSTPVITPTTPAITTEVTVPAVATSTTTSAATGAAEVATAPVGDSLQVEQAATSSTETPAAAQDTGVLAKVRTFLSSLWSKFKFW